MTCFNLTVDFGKKWWNERRVHWLVLRLYAKVCLTVWDGSPQMSVGHIPEFFLMWLLPVQLPPSRPHPRRLPLPSSSSPTRRRRFFLLAWLRRRPRGKPRWRSSRFPLNPEPQRRMSTFEQWVKLDRLPGQHYWKWIKQWAVVSPMSTDQPAWIHRGTKP